MTQLHPVENNVIVEPMKEEKKTSSGLILPDSDNKKPSKGTVLAVGPGKVMQDGSRGPMEVQVGDVVHFTMYSPNEVELGTGEGKSTLLIIEQSSILAIEK